VSQSQVSKIVRGQFKRPEGNAKELFEYSQRLAAKRRKQVNATEDMRATLTDRLLRAWDGTAEGAQALCDILDGAHKLRTL
jgi:hypothetical protein